jgi:hypothetical protein
MSGGTSIFGSGIAAERRRWLYGRLREMAQAGELPTTVSSLYYAGVGEGRWPSDDEAKDAGRKRLPRQDVSDAVQWLIDRDPAIASWVVDFSHSVLDYSSPSDLKAAVYEYAMDLRLSPWENGEMPIVIVESRSAASALAQTAARFSVPLVPLGGQAGRSFLRHDVAGLLAEMTPIAYIGDWNPAGLAIESNVERKLRGMAPDWLGDWESLAVTDEDAARLPTKTKVDRRHRPPLSYLSVEAEALGTTVLRQRLTEWLGDRLPPEFDREWHEQQASAERQRLLRLLET